MDQLEFYETKLRYETDAWDLSEALKNNENIVVIDTRSNEAFAREHIPSAINIPHRTMSATSTKFLDKQKTCITYCDGIGCNASTKGARNLVQLGFQVKELLGGLDWWKRDGHPTEGSTCTMQSDTTCGC